MDPRVKVPSVKMSLGIGSSPYSKTSLRGRSGGGGAAEGSGRSSFISSPLVPPISPSTAPEEITANEQDRNGASRDGEQRRRISPEEEGFLRPPAGGLQGSVPTKCSASI